MKNISFHLNRKLWVTMALLLTLALPGFAQKITVHGYVDDELGEPLIGATVMEKGTSNGTATDIDGKFTITVDSNATLVVSYIGYDPIEVAVKGQTDIKVTMKENATTLAETVVIGYGSVKKSDATGSVAVVKPDEVEAGMATSVQDMLVGQTPGVVVTKSGGPFGSANIRIRGEASLSANSNPLIVLDGVPISSGSVLGMDNPLAMIAPENIESMTILKDASATAIYGSRASNGVIIVTTKKGTKGRPQVNFSANMYVDYARKTQKVLDADGFRNFIANDPRFGVESAAYLGLGKYNTDWQDEIYRTAISSDYSLSVGGTAGLLPYRVSATYTNSNGILKTSSMDRATFGFNLTPKFFNDHLSVNANAKGYYIKSNFAATDAIWQAVAFNPTAPVRDNQPIVGGTASSQYKYLFNGYTEPYSNNGSEIALLNDGTYNPVASLEQTHNWAEVWRSNGNIQFDYSFHFLPELHANLNLGYDVTSSNDHYRVDGNSHMAWKDHNKYGGEWSRKNNEFTSNTLLEFYLNYKKDFEAIDSNLDVVAGYSWQRFAGRGHSQGANSDQGIALTPGLLNTIVTPDGLMLDWNPATESQVGQVFKKDPVNEEGNYHWKNHLQLLSFYGRINYTLKNRYLLTFTLRGDATSRFSKDNRWGIFPAVALGWKLNEEKFLANADFLSDLKLRLGWGQTGQQDVGSYNNYTPTYNISQPGSYYPNGVGGWLTPFFPNGINPDLKWETTTTWNIGIDYGFLNNRINGSVELYRRDTKDLLSTVEVPAGSSTVNRLPQNIGSMRNYGIEFAINAKPVVTDDFTWTLSYNVGWNHNEITDLNGLQFETGGGFGGTGGNCQIQKEGYPLYSYYLYQQVYDEAGNPIEGAYVDQNGDGIIDGNDRVVNRSALPKVTMTFGSNFRYKNWDFGFSLRASLGNYVYASSIRGGTATDGVFRNGYGNLFESDVYFQTNQNYSDYWVRNASYLRCDNITLGYNFDDLLKNKVRFRMFAGVQNPFVITKYKGVDPEVASGVDGNIYPRATTWTLGLVFSY